MLYSRRKSKTSLARRSHMHTIHIYPSAPATNSPAPHPFFTSTRFKVAKCWFDEPRLFEGKKNKELDHPKLRETLGNKTEFTQQEWGGFGIANLRMDQFVKRGDEYFKPAAPASPQAPR